MTQQRTEASYLRVAVLRHENLDATVDRTVEVIPGRVLIDVDRDGRILGIERIGGVVDLDTAVVVLRWVRVQPLDQGAVRAAVDVAYRAGVAAMRDAWREVEANRRADHA